MPLRTIRRYFFYTCLMAIPLTSSALTATWAALFSTAWNSAGNWSPSVAYPGQSPTPYDVAIFSTTSSQTTAVNTANIILNNITFTAPAPAFTISNSGTFTLAGSGILNGSSNTQNITNAALLVFQGSADAGTNTIITNNSGAVLNFQDMSSAPNARIVNNGTLNVGNLTATSITMGALSGNGPVNLSNKELRIGTANTSTTISGVISGVDGQLTKIGTGALTLSGNNTYTGNTNISAGTLQLGTGLTSGTVAGNIVDDAALIFNRSDATTYAGVISGIGNVTKAGAGTHTLTGNNTYIGGTTISGGSLQLGNGSTTGNIVGDITNNATLIFNRSDSLAYAGLISGTGAVTKLGAGTLTYTANNTYSGATTITTGALEIGNGGTVGNITGSITDNAALIFNRSDAISYGGVISGTGTLTKSGAGTLSLTGTNTYTGDTTISAGTLQIGSASTTGSVAGNIIDNAALIFNRSNAISFGGTISGTGTLTQAGSNTLTLTAENTYTGGTTVSAGTLQVGNGGTTGNIVGDIVDNAALIFNRSDAITYAGVISGTGSVTKSGGGLRVLTGNSTYTGGTTISAGFLQLGDGNTTGSIVGNITNNAALIFNRSDSQTYAGLISGTGTVTKQGAGTLTYTANNTYSGTTTVSSGTLEVGNGGTAGAIAGAVLNNGALRFNRSDLSTYAGAITGTGAVTKLGAGNLTLTGDSSYSGGTTISGGTLQIGGGSTTGSILGDIVNNAALIFSRSDATTYAGVISGTGSMTKQGTGTRTLTGNNTYTGGTTISAGTLQLGDGNTTGSIVGNIVDNATLTFNRSDSQTYSGLISGTGAVIKQGVGTLTYTANNSYTGATTISAGTLEIGNGGTVGAITGAITNNAALIFNRSDALSYGGVISGIGTVTKSGAGTLTLTAANTYTTATTISGGTLQIGNGGTTGSLVSGSITNNAALIFNRSNGSTYSGVVSGTGTLTKLGAGTLTLLGDNLYTGGTTVTAGVLQIGNNGVSGSVVGDILNNAAVTMNRLDDTTYAGVISGTGSVTKLGTGIRTFTGNNTYTGVTTISVGTLQLGNGGTTGSVVGNIVDGITLIFNRSDSLTYAGLISGAGTVTKLGAGTLTYTGNNTYTGATTITAGALEIGNGGTTGAIASSVTNNAGLIFNRSDALTYSGVVSGTGTMTKSGAGTLTLTGANTYSGNTTISAGTLQIGSGTTGSIASNVIDNGALSFNRSNAVTFANIISGTGTLTQLGAGTLTFTADNTYTGVTTISAGTLELGSGGTTGRVTGDIVDNAALTFNRSDSQTYAGLISGTGTVTKLGAGTLTYTGNNTYSGATTITAGTLEVGSNGTSGAIVGNVTDNAALIFNRSDALNYGGIISGTGTMTKSGAGTLTLTGANTFTGGTTISAGTLAIGNGGTTGSVAGNITDNGALSFNRSNALTFAGIVSGTGSLTKLGTGTLTLTGENTYTGGTTITAGTLQIGNSSTTGTVVGDITNNAALIFDRSDATTYAGTISGTGSVTKAGAGTRTFTNNNTYTGGTTISAGTLQLGNGGTTGSVVGNITDNAALIFNRSDSQTYTGLISGTGTVTKQGAGTLTYTANNTYTGATTITTGTLELGNGGTTGSLAGNITDNAALIFNRSDALSYGGVISGTGTMTKSGAGTLTLIGANTFTGGTTISAGAVQIGNGGAAGAIVGNVNNNAALIFNLSSALTFGGTISGSGTLTQQGSNTVTLAADNTYTGTTTITTGTLQVGNGGAAGNIAGDIVDNAALIFNRSDDTTYNGVISGTGTVTKLGTGSRILTGTNTYTGGTTITAGTLQLGNGGTTGSIVGNITDNAALIFNRSDSQTYSGLISGTGTVTKQGLGTLTYTANNTYTGATTISAGALEVGNGGTVGAIAGAITNNAALIFNRADAVTYSGVISGTGSVTKSAANTLTLTGTNTYTGGTIINAGTLQVGAGGTTGRITGNLTNNSAIIFNRSNTTSFTGNIDGSGTLTKLGAGTLTLTGDSVYTGLTTITAGTLQIGNSGTTGSVVSNIVNNAALIFDRSDASTYVGSISGTGSFTKAGIGTNTLIGNNTYTGGTTISAGTLQLGNGGTVGSIVGNITNNAALIFNRSDSQNYTDVISGVGTVTKLGAGTLTYLGNNTYTGGTTITAGTLEIGNGGAVGAITGNITDNAALTFNRSDAQIYAGIISGTGTMTKLGAGTLTLSNDNTYTGSTSISAGTLQVGNGGTSGDIVGNIINNAALIFNRSDTTSYGGVISGTGAVTKLGTGTRTLTADNTYTGGTTISAGALQLGNGGTAGSVVGNIIDNAALVFNRSDNTTYAGVISGSGTFTNAGSGTSTFTGNNTYTGGTTISAGTLQLGNGGTVGGIVGNITNNAALIFNRSDSQNYADVISGAGAVTKLGAGTLTYLGNNTYTGGTTVTAGTLEIGNGGTVGAIMGNVTNNGALTFNRSDAQIYAGIISGTGNMTKLGAGTLTLSNDNTYTGGTTISAGTLQVGNGGTSGDIVGNIINNAALIFNRSDATSYGGVISGTGAVTKLGTGTRTLTGNSTYTGGTTISAGTLQLGNGGTTGSIVGSILDNGALIFNRSDAQTYSGVISGIGVVTKLGGGTLTYTGDNTYSGMTTISAGVLQLGNGGTSGSLVGNITNDANLIFNRSDAQTYAGVISGLGNVAKLGTGTLTYTGNNTYTGSTTISAGTLEVGNGGNTGSIVGDVTDNGALIFNRSDDLVYNGSISGSGSMTKSGSNRLTLTNDNSYLGGTTVSAGILQLGNGGLGGAIVGNIIDNGEVAFNLLNPLTFVGTISGSGSLTQMGGNTLTLTADNTYTGGTTIMAGTLEIGNGATTGSLVGNILDNSALIFNRSDAITYNGVISGVGTVTKIGSGVLTYTNDNTYSGITNITAGTLAVGNGGTTGSIVGDVSNNGMVIFNRSNALEYSGLISGTGGLTKLSSNTLTLIADNTYTGDTTIMNGVLQLGNGGPSGSLAGNIIDNAAVIFDRSNALSYAGIISGPGTLTKLGSNTLTLSGNNTYIGGTTITSGTLQLGDGGTSGGIFGDILNNAALIFNRSDSTLHSGQISGTGQVTKQGAGTLTYLADNTYTGVTTINDGALSIGNGGAAGSVIGDIVDSASLIFNRSNAYIYNGQISGTGTVTKLGVGTLTYTGNNNYTGGTTITSGTLEIGNGGATGSVSGDILNNAALTFNRTNALSYEGVISGTGSMTKLGAGTLTFTGNNTYSGATTISNGTLQLGEGGTSGSVVGDIINNGGLIFNRSDALTYSDIISGSGTMTKSGTNMLTLLGANTYSGGTTISEGTLQIGNGGTTGNILGNIVDDGHLIFNHSNARTYAGVISGSGAFTKLGSNTLTFTGDNTYLGGTTIADGSLQIGSGGTTGSIAGDITNSAALIFNRSDALSYTGVIDGTGTVAKLGNATLIFTGNNNYTGMTTITAGSLAIGNGGSTGSIVGDVTNNGVLIFNRTTALNYDGLVTGTGSLTKQGSNTLTMTANNTYSGGTTISAGVLQLGNGGTTGSIVGNITDNAGLIFNRSDDLIFANIISGTGAVTKAAGNTLTFTGNNSYAGNTTITNGALQLGNGAATGSVVGDIVDNAALIFNRSDDINYAGLISGVGTMTKLGSGILTLTGANSYTGDTTITSGVLQVGDGGASGAIMGNIINHTALIFNRSNAQTYAGVISSSGTVTKLGAGVLTFTGDNTYSGLTTISAGTLQLGNGGTTGFLSGDIVDDAQLIFNRGNDVTYSGIISGSGTVTKLGNGMFTLNSVNSYSGLTTVGAGRLLLGDTLHPSASVAGSINVAANGVLGGNGTVGQDVNNNGVVSPGMPEVIGTLHIDGNYTQSNTATLITQIDADGNNDLLNIIGSADLSGTVAVNAVNGGFIRLHRYTFLTADGGVFNKFTNVDEDDVFTQGYLTGHVYYLPNAVEFTIDFNPLMFGDIVQTPNQKAVADYLLVTGGTPQITALVSSITTQQGLLDMLDQLSGATYANQLVGLAYVGNWFESQMNERFNQLSAYSQPNCGCIKQRSAVWFDLYNNHQDLKSKADISGLTANCNGVALGAETNVNDHVLLGGGLAYTHFQNHATVRENAETKGDLFQVGVYANYKIANWLIGAAADFGFTNSLHTQRYIQDVASVATPKGLYRANLLAQQFNIAYDINTHHLFKARPFIGVVNQAVSRGSFAEEGAAGFDLNIHRSHYYSTRSQAGLTVYPVNLLPESFLSVSWEHELQNRRGNFNAQLVGLEGDFYILGSEIGRDAKVVKTGVSLISTKCTNLVVLYEGRFAGGWKENAAKCQLSMNF